MLHIISVVLVALSAISVHGFTAEQVRYQQETLALHNSLRARHCVGALQLNDTLSRIAQTYAESLAASGKFEHSNNGHGENLYMMGSSAPITNVDVKKATQAWYDEIKDYNYAAPGFAMATGHFTQVVWKGSTRLGVGVALGNGGRRVIVVANYSPPGNYLGQFPQNVLKGAC